MSEDNDIKINKMRIELELGLQLKNDLEERGLNINDNYVIKVYGSSIEFVLDKDGKRVFGGSVQVYGYRGVRGGEREIQISTGSMGAVDNTCQATVESTLLMAEAFMNWEEFAETCEYMMDRAEDNDNANS